MFYVIYLVKMQYRFKISKLTSYIILSKAVMLAKDTYKINYIIVGVALGGSLKNYSNVEVNS